MSDTAWQDFFNNHAPVYMNNSFTRDTQREVDFLMELFQLAPGSRILEIGCGTGRHSVELSRRGFRITGIDLSVGMLAEAAQAAESAGVDVEYIHADARHYMPEAAAFDAAICLCEGAFCLMGHDDDPIESDVSILRNVAHGLKPNALFVLTALNGYRKIRTATSEDIAKGIFNPLTMVERYEMQWDSTEGAQKAITYERAYLPTELTLFCRLAGLDVAQIWGGTAGNWGRRPLDMDEMEIMLVARKA